MKEMLHEICKDWFCSNLYSDRAVILRITEVRHSQRGPARFPDTFGNLTRGDPSPGEQGGGGQGGARLIGEPDHSFRHRIELKSFHRTLPTDSHTVRALR